MAVLPAYGPWLCRPPPSTTSLTNHEYNPPMPRPPCSRTARAAARRCMTPTPRASWHRYVRMRVFKPEARSRVCLCVCACMHVARMRAGAGQAA